MRHLSSQMLCLFVVTGLGGIAIAAPKSAVLTKGATENRSAPVVFVNGEPVRSHSVHLMLKRQERLGVPSDARIEQRVKDELVVQTILAQQAVKAKLDQDPEVAAQLDLNRLSMLSNAYLNDYFKTHLVTDEAVGADYERRRSAGEIMEYRVRHLSVPSEDEARSILEKIKAGEKMDELAKKHSTDPGANVNGGDIGWFRPDTFVDESFAQAVAGLKQGETTQKPVSTRWGWQIIRVEEGPRAVKELPPFDRVQKNLKEVMRQRMMKQKLDELVESLKARAVISSRDAQAAGPR